MDESEITIRHQRTLSDEEVRHQILLLSKCLTIAEYQRKPLEEKKPILTRCKQQGAANRQLARITGVSYSVIQRLKEVLGTDSPT